MNKGVDVYLTEGCGRCNLVGTPKCKVHTWNNELVLLRTIILDCGLTEEVKWGSPCYTYNNKNVLMLAALKSYCAISFFKGVLLNDSKNILDKPGENSQHGRLIKFTKDSDLAAMEKTIKQYIKQAIEIEKAGLKVETVPNPEPIPDEFKQVMDENPELKSAFFALTPGRQRSWILHFSSAKQAQTRISRIEKYTPKILQGKGFHD
jgi:uncharacterized protein YdeI (YjbR/CyaY-like superfamily)